MVFGKPHRRGAFVGLLALGLPLGLAACGDTQTERTVSGGALGAAAGAVTAGVAGGDELTGALVGGAAGAAVGALSDEDWRDRRRKRR